MIIPIDRARATLTDLVAKVRQWGPPGEAIVLTKRGQPVAEIVKLGTWHRATLLDRVRVAWGDPGAYVRRHGDPQKGRWVVCSTAATRPAGLFEGDTEIEALEKALSAAS